MKTMRTAAVATGTSKDLIRAARLGARLGVRWRRAEGRDDDSIREEVLARFRADLEAESFGVYTDETLMAAVQRTVDVVLEGAPSRRWGG